MDLLGYRQREGPWETGGRWICRRMQVPSAVLAAVHCAGAARCVCPEVWPARETIAIGRQGAFSPWFSWVSSAAGLPIRFGQARAQLAQQAGCDHQRWQPPAVIGSCGQAHGRGGIALCGLCAAFNPFCPHFASTEQSLARLRQSTCFWAAAEGRRLKYDAFGVMWQH